MEIYGLYHAGYFPEKRSLSPVYLFLIISKVYFIGAASQLYEFIVQLRSLLRYEALFAKGVWDEIHSLFFTVGCFIFHAAVFRDVLRRHHGKKSELQFLGRRVGHGRGCKKQHHHRRGRAEARGPGHAIRSGNPCVDFYQPEHEE